MSKSNIEWTEDTWNPVTGCTPNGEGCKNCYARRMHKRLTAMKQPKYQQPFSKVVCHPEVLNQKFPKKPCSIFVCSMSDLLHKDVPDEFIHNVMAVIKSNPFHTFQILTKRPSRMGQYFQESYIMRNISNLQLGFSASTPDEYNAGIGYLRNTPTPAAVKFVSLEPLIADMGDIDLTGLDWVIVGAESGPGARLMNNDHAIKIVNQCKADGIPVFVKQLTKTKGRGVEKDMSKFPPKLQYQEYPRVKL